MADESGTLVVWAPVERSSVPLAGALQVFSTQVVRAGTAAFGISSGVPKLRPVLLQSGAGGWGGGGGVEPADVAGGPGAAQGELVGRAVGRGALLDDRAATTDAEAAA